MDDDLGFAEVVADSLVDRDVVAVAVSDPHEALKLAAQTPFAAAVVDLVMPGIDGLELSRELRKRSPDLEVLLLTGQGSLHSAIEGIRNELFDYFQKATVNPVRLRRSVRAAIARHERRRSERAQQGSGRPEAQSKLQRLCEASARLGEEHDLDHLLVELVEAAKALVDAEAARVVLVESGEGGDLTVRCMAGDGRACVGDRLPRGEGIAALVASTGAPLRIEDPWTDARYSPRCDEMPTERPGLLAVPLSRPGLLGVLMAAGCARPVTDEDVALLQGLACLGATAIEALRARLRG